MTVRCNVRGNVWHNGMTTDESTTMKDYKPIFYTYITKFDIQAYCSRDQRASY